MQVDPKTSALDGSRESSKASSFGGTSMAVKIELPRDIEHHLEKR
jgi:hypothetical protein